MAYTKKSFPDKYIPTVFDDIDVHITYKPTGQLIKLNIIDTSGLDDYDKLRPTAYPMTDVFIVCFDIARRISLQNVKDKWAHEIRRHNPTTPIILVGAKLDLRQNPNIKANNEVSHTEGWKMARLIGAEAYVECSARTVENLNNAFAEAV